MAKYMDKWFKPLSPVHVDELLFSTGVTSICEMLGFTIFEPGDALLLSAPIYQAFKSDFGLRAEWVVLHFISDIADFPLESTQYLSLFTVLTNSLLRL